MVKGENDKGSYKDGMSTTNGKSEDGEFRAAYLVRGTVLSLSFVEPNKWDRPNRRDEPAPRHAPPIVPEIFFDSTLNLARSGGTPPIICKFDRFWRAATSNCYSLKFSGAYFRYYQHQPSLTNV
jgi:hypothetical protein